MPKLKLSSKIYLIILCLSMTNLSYALNFSSGPEKGTMIELFTSEGCSSCPAADKWLSRLKNDPKLWNSLFPIALHVDYWDQLGWKDRFASSQFSLRQRNYQAQGHISQVYTPGFVVGGEEWRGFFKRHSLPIKPLTNVGELQVRIKDQQVITKFSPLSNLATKLTVHVAIVGFDLTTDIKSGENKGRKLTHDFVVIAYNSSSMILDSDEYRYQSKLPQTNILADKKAIVVWLSTEQNLKPIQVTGGWL